MLFGLIAEHYRSFLALEFMQWGFITRSTRLMYDSRPRCALLAVVSSPLVGDASSLVVLYALSFLYPPLDIIYLYMLCFSSRGSVHAFSAFRWIGTYSIWYDYIALA